MMSQEDPEYLADLLYFYGSLYGPQLVLVATLSAITIYRREISCNHVYAVTEGEEEAKVQQDDYVGVGGRPSIELNPEERDEIWNRAGLFCRSGSSLGPLVGNLANSLLSLISDSSETNDNDSRDGGADISRSSAAAAVFGLKSNLSAGDLLELAGSYYCGEPVASLLLRRKPIHIRKRLYRLDPQDRPPLLTRASTVSCNTSFIQSENHDDLLGLPTDAWIHILAFLNPKDVISFGSTDQACHTFVDQGETANMVWKTLWKRDYAWILHQLPVGKRAAARSGGGGGGWMMEPRHVFFNKHTYFRFALSWLDFVLAGNNTLDECLVGIGGHIYDMSLFVLSHPGSPETVMVHAGQDATDFFYRIGHSKGARKLAQSMCIVVDTSRLTKNGGGGGVVGLRPTKYTKFATNSDGDRDEFSSPTIIGMVEAPEESETNRKFANQQKRSNVLLETLVEFEQERQVYEAKALTLLRHHASSVLSQPKVYYDPLNQKWKVWYTGSDLVNVFLDDL